MKYYSFLILCVTLYFQARGQSNFKFAFLSDTHISVGAPSIEDLQRSINDINADTSLKFVILTGDVTEFGANIELSLAKHILDNLNKPLYIIPGNHESTWSESGTNTFARVFGSERCCFKYGGYLFVGTACGPSMKMSPGQVPREDIVWLDSVLAVPENKKCPIIFLNHYPLDSSLNNWYDIIALLRKMDTRIVLNGHGHIDHIYNYDGIPGVMGRSNLRADKDTGAYNIVTIKNDSMYFQDRTPFGVTHPAWTVQYIGHHDFAQLPPAVTPSFSINKEYKNVREAWRYLNSSDIGSGLSESYTSCIYTTDTRGNLLALHLKNGKPAWAFHTVGKIYSVPFLKDNVVVFSSSNGYIYGVDAKKGKLIWEFKGNGASVGSPLVINDTVYIGGSDGHFRALGLHTGKQLWDFASVEGFVIDRPLYHEGLIYFGSWGREFYALNAATGALVWKWTNGEPNRMYSPAGCWPVYANGKIFIVAPDNYMTSLDAKTGRQIARFKWPKDRVRESMGLSTDSSLVYVKTMSGRVWGIETGTDSLEVAWKADVELGYEIIPTHLVNTDKVLFVPTQSGILVAINKQNGSVLFKHKISNCMITGIQPIGTDKVVVSTSDGVVSLLKY